MRAPLTTPTIHRNGTPRSDLQQRYEVAYRMLTAALQALVDTAPHGRDYYLQEIGAIERAIREHEARLAAVAQVRDELLLLHDSCSEGAQQLKLQAQWDAADRSGTRLTARKRSTASERRASNEDDDER